MPATDQPSTADYSKLGKTCWNCNYLSGAELLYIDSQRMRYFWVCPQCHARNYAGYVFRFDDPAYKGG